VCVRERETTLFFASGWASRHLGALHGFPRPPTTMGHCVVKSYRGIARTYFLTKSSHPPLVPLDTDTDGGFIFRSICTRLAMTISASKLGSTVSHGPLRSPAVHVRMDALVQHTSFSIEPSSLRKARGLTHVTCHMSQGNKTRQDKTRQDKNDVKICWRRKRVHYQIKILASVIYNEGSGQKTPRPFISSHGMYTSRAVPLIQLATEGCKDVVDVDVVVEDKQDKQG